MKFMKAHGKTLTNHKSKILNNQPCQSHCRPKTKGNNRRVLQEKSFSNTQDMRIRKLGK